MAVDVAYSSLAILNVNWETRGHDYIANFVPFVVEALGAAAESEISLSRVQDEVLGRFGLGIPQGALKTILKRAAKQGYVSVQEGVYRCNEGKVGEFQLEELRAEAMDAIEDLIRKYIEFSSDFEGVELTHEEALDRLGEYLDSWAVPLLADVVDGREAAKERPEELSIGVSAFIEHACLTDKGAFNCLEKLVKGTLLANVVYYPKWREIGRGLRGFEVYVDTEVALRVLGFAGTTTATPYRELLDLLQKVGARVRCFSHTAREIRGVLNAAAAILRAPESERYLRGYFEVYEWALRTGKRPQDLELLGAGIDKALRGLNIRVVEPPEHEVALGIDEEALAEYLESLISYRRREALLHDVDCVTSIHRIRHGRFPDQLEDADAVFLTSNLDLARSTRRFFRDEYRVGRSAADVCMLDHALTTLVWLKSPLDAPDLPRHRIIADCYAALSPNDAVWTSYLTEIKRLQKDETISEDDFFILRYSIEAKRALMGVTKGSVDAFAEGTVPEILRRARDAIRHEAGEALAEKDRDLAAERTARALEKEERLGQERRRRDELRRKADRFGAGVSLVLGGLSLVALAIGVWLTTPGLGEITIPKALAPLLLLLVFVAVILNLWKGATVQRGVEWVGQGASLLVQRLYGWVGGESETAQPEEGE